MLANGEMAEGRSSTLVADQVSALQLLVTEQTRKMEEQGKELKSMAAASATAEAARATEEAQARQAMVDWKAAFDQLQAGNHGAGRNVHGGGGHGGGGCAMRVAPINAIKMDQCPAAGKDQCMREWAKLARRWAHSLPVELLVGEGRY